MLKKSILCALTILIILSLCIPTALASNETASGIIRPLWTYMNLVQNSFNINSMTGLASMESDITCYSGTVNKVKMDNYLQRYLNGAWSTINSWSQTTQDDYAIWSKTYYVTAGYSYRLLTYFYAYNGSTLLESTSLATSSKYY